MDCKRARGRYLAALGLTAAFGCRSAEPTPTSAPTVASEGTAPPATAAATSPEPSTTAKATGTPVAHHTGPWVPVVDEPMVRPRPGIAHCPQGPFCVPQPAAVGASPAPAPHQMCASTVPLPEGIGPGTKGGRAPSVTFDGARTTAERAGDPAACCYHWNVLCVGGRALRGPEGAITAAAARRDDWLSPEGAARTAPPPIRDALAAHWEREAAFEHASVAAFARASLALLAVGAPPDLVRDTHAAAIDEVEHARLAYTLASAYGGSPRGPGLLPVERSPGAPSLSGLAVETFLDGCAGEAAAALALREAATTTEDGAMRAILDRIAEDEERHAELAWRTVAWALRTGGEDVARSLAGATATLREELAGVVAATPSTEPDLSAYGALGTAAQRAVRRRALAEVVLPCVEALLEAVPGAVRGAPGAGDHEGGCAPDPEEMASLS